MTSRRSTVSSSRRSARSVRRPPAARKAPPARRRPRQIRRHRRARLAVGPPGYMVGVRPGSTYRVQLHAGFGFADAASLIPYLHDLGVSHLYCSPYLQAADGSTHGYDVVDPERLNEELGGEDAYARLLEAQRAHGLGQVLDIVPNHMAVVGRQN